MFDQLHEDDVVSLCCVGILQLVLLGVEDRRAVPDWILRLANDRDGRDKYPWGSYVWPILYSQLKNANVKRWSSLYATQPIDEVDKKTYSIFGFTWAFKVPRVLVTCRSKLGLIKTIRDLIRGTPREELFKKTCFSQLLDQKEWTENCILIHFMSGRQIEVLGDENDVVPLKYDVVENFKIQFDREEFCLVTGLKFVVEYWADYNDEDEPIPFRRWMFPSSLDGKPIKGNTVLQVIKSKM
nr:hypothetical protein [Tanacetum cinerariifolium]